MTPETIAILTGITAGVCAGYSGAFQLRRPHPGWVIAAVLAIWLTFLYSGTWSV